MKIGRELSACTDEKDSEEGSLQAQSNLKFLMVLKAPCQELSAMIPSKISEILPKILKLIRMIWMHSEFYNTKERIAGLLRKLSTEVINRCIAAINLDKVFGGFVESSKNTLNECISCCESWKNIYNKTAESHDKYSKISWKLDETGIFAQIDAFIQRCKDLVEVCNCQYHFCRAQHGDKIPLPIFKGQRGSEILRGYLEIENIFEKNLNALISVKKTILDVKAMSWLDDFSRFRSGMKDLEVMMQNLISSAFDTVITVEDGLKILEVFMHASVREGIKRIIEKETTKVFEILINEINAVKKEMLQKPSYLLPWQPKYGGQGLSVKLMKRGLERTIALLTRARFLPQVVLSGEIRGIYSLVFHSMDECIMKNFYEWTSELAKDPYKLLDIPLLKRNIEKGFIDINYNESLLKSFREVDYWERLSQELPHYIYDTSSRREAYRIQRENMLLLVKEYNRIIVLLSPEERGLFRERIMFLDRKLLPGLTKITWSQTQNAEQFQYECRNNIGRVLSQLDSYKMANIEIVSLCLKLSESLLIKINQKRVYEEFEYQADSTQHCRNVLNMLMNRHQEIIRIMLKTYEFFKNDGNEVQQHWYGYTLKMDMLVEEALRWNIKWSLQEVSKAIIGDGKAGQSPMFKINILLKAVDGKEAVCFFPEIQQLSAMIYESITRCFEALKKFERLPDLLARKTKKESISTAISKDPDVIKVQKSIAAGIQTGVNNLMQYLSTWDVYREIWEVDKKKFIENYRYLNPTSTTFDADIFRYSELSLNVQMQESIVGVQFVMVDASNLKMAILAHCQDWQNKLLKLLFEIAYTHLTFLYHYMEESKTKLSIVPATLKQLEEVMPVWDKLSNERNDIEKTFPELQSQFSVLTKYEVEMDEDVLSQLKLLPQAWNNYGRELEDSEFTMKKIKEKFKLNLLAQAEDLRKLITASMDEFHAKGPFSGSIPLNEALLLIEHYKDQNNQLREQEVNLKKGLMLFKLDQPPSRDIMKMEHELDQLEEVWQLAKQWDGYWNLWKNIRFVNLRIKEIDDLSGTLFKKIVKLSKELKSYNWGVIEDEKKKVMTLRNVIPIVINLNNPALRPRHWLQLQSEVGRTFDHQAADFNLEKIVDWEFASYIDLIAEISQSATNEIAIEEALSQISATWETIEFEFIPYKDKELYKIKFTEDIPIILDDNQNKLGLMKSSKYVISFLVELDSWEKVLSIILETIETMATVQKLWVYLENIFSSEDIKKQLPTETIYFEDLDLKWKSLVNGLMKIKNVYRACHSQGLLDLLKKMHNRLEFIMNSLDIFLETKRLVFPRFYFISNNDLMEVLGMSKSPVEMQYHMRKCFSNIKTLTFTKVGLSQKWEATHMNSADGESVMFVNPTSLDGPVEIWMADLEKNMKASIKEELKKCKTNLRKNLNKRDKWIKEHPGQTCILASQLQWTADVTRGLIMCKEHGDKKALKSLRKRHVILLNKFSEVIRSSLSKVQRLKIQSLITIEVHSRDVLERLVKASFVDPQSFEWHKELRTYWDRELSECIFRQTTAQFQYGYEYLGNSGRLVITPITERCYITLTMALHKHKGGSPKGLTGTGKTETVKDLGKALGVFVVVVNCSESVDFKSMSRTFSGLAQSGAWGCFDEFNRMNIEVLSVVAQQIFSILTALSAGLQRFTFENQDIKLEPLCGIFATMNIGCFGCNELPDNLKAMFRPVALAVPDTGMIAEVILFVEGFSNTKIFAKKLYTLHTLAQQQLSREEHYDFGLRTLLAVLKYAGRKRRILLNLSDEEILVYSINEMNHAKLISSDLPLFKGITSDLFPGVEIPFLENTKFKTAMEHQIHLMGLQPIKYLEMKVLQIHETTNASHVGMLVGNTMSGKTTAWKVLQATCCALAKEGEPGFQNIKDYPVNPKALSMSKLYGKYDLSKGKWSDGIVPSIMRTICSDEKLDEKWVVFDGPVDALWIECMNSLIDDNKILTLTNGERIALSEQVFLMFEVNDLENSTPAIISRCGVIYFEYKELGWQPYVASWLAKKTDRIVSEELRMLFEKFIPKTQHFKEVNLCKEMSPLSELGGVISLCTLFDILYSQMDMTDQENVSRLVELLFFFSLIWSLCASVDEDGRKKLDSFVREIEGTFPNKDSVYEYYIETKSKTWSHWEEKLKSGWKFTTNVPFHKIIVPTIDVVRYSYLVEALVTNKCPVLLVGPRGGCKTMVAEDVMNKLKAANYSNLKINFSANISSDTLQDLVESRLEKRMRETYAPMMNKKMILFIDDFSIPSKELYGGQPPLELISFMINYGFIYDRLHQSRKYVKDLVLMAASDPMGGGRPYVIPRLQSKLHVISILQPQDSQIKRIFSNMLSYKLQDFEEDLKLLADTLTTGSIEFHKAISTKLLPVPSKMHYTFNVRDISKVFTGLMRVKKAYHENKVILCRLWIHECFRVYHDRLISDKDREIFVNILTEKLAVVFDLTYHNICKDKIPPLFSDLLNVHQIYEDHQNIQTLREGMREQLEQYNNNFTNIPMDLVLFNFAVENVSRITRAIESTRGHMILVGIGGSGKRSLSRLATFLCKYEIIEVKISKSLRSKNFRKELQKVYNKVGVENKKLVLLLTEAELMADSIMDDLDSLLTMGEVSNLIRYDSLLEGKLADDMRNEGIEVNQQTVIDYLLERVQNNLHVILCMSPVGDPLRNLIRSYASLIRETTINWLGEWPHDALLDVAEKYFDNPEISRELEPKLRPNVVKMFAMIHTSAANYAAKSTDEFRMCAYVTPTNYFEFIECFKLLLQEKKDDIQNNAMKLKHGLWKIDDTKSKVEGMTIELVDAKKNVEKFQKQCEEYLANIIQQKREADEQAKLVAQKSEKIADEELKCRKMAEVAQADLAEALPALEEAKKALEALNKKDITEIKSYGKPPLLVEKVLEAVMILRGNEPSWAEAKKQLGDQNFIKQLINFDLDNISDSCLKKVSGYCIQSDFQPEIVGRVSTAAKSLCMWVRAVEQYAKIYRVVEPKRHRLRVAEAQLREKMNLLQEAKNKLAEIEAKMAEIKMIYDSNLQAKEEYRIKAEIMEIKLERASQLLDGLSGERERWSHTVQVLEAQIELVIGNIVLVSGFVTYLGLFSGKYRRELFTKMWMPEALRFELSITMDLDPVQYLCDPTVIRDWILQGLPADDFSTQNALIMTKSRKFPLIIDPQGQAQKWIRYRESSMGLQIIDVQTPDYMKTVEAAIQIGLPVMVENTLEEIEDSFDPLLNKSIKNREGVLYIKLGDREIKYNPAFHLYFTTRLSKPCYSPETFSQTTIVNFAVTELGLQNQLLGVVIRKERPELEEQKEILVRSIANGKKKIKQLEDDILRLLAETEGSLLDDEQLLITLQTSKTTSQELHDSIETSEATEMQIDETREGYRLCAERASILFFVLNDMSNINPMYQFALDSYIDLFNLSIEKSHKSTKLEDRIIHLNDYHTYAVYKHACRALFEKHKLLFSFHMCAEIMRKAAKINAEEYNFFLQGGIVVDRDNQFDNPCSWLPSACWDNITELDKLANFHGLVTSFEQYQKDWNAWYTSAEPENATLPGEWEISCNELQRILILRSIRQDRVSFCISSFITNNLGSRFVEPPILSFKSVLEESTCRTPLLFVLSPGVDPIQDLVTVAESKGMMPHRFLTLSLGQGQVPFATQMVLKGSKEGLWVFLANCHLSLKWMVILDKLVKDLQAADPGPHPDFRLWLSSSPHVQFPISILQTCLKMTTEPPKGLKANMKRMYSRITDHQFSRCKHPEKYKKLLFSLIFFHSIVEERRKFLTLGWNVIYDFNDSDFEASESLLSLYLDEYEETPFEALKFLIAVINYGGHVIDDWDRRLLYVYISDYFCEEALTSILYKLSVLPTYYIPRDGSLNSYREYVSMLPNMDHPEAFGQHTNADITSQSQEAKMLFESLLSMETSRSIFSGDREDKVLEICENIKKQLPNNIDYATTEKIFIADKSLLKPVLLQEILRYDSLLDLITEQLSSLENGIKGIMVMPLNAEDFLKCIYEAQVPTAWMKWYPSMKPLASWTKDLVTRVEQLATWATTAHPPKIFWLSGFTYPTAFLTAVLQQSSRMNGISIDLLSWEFTVMTVDDSNIASAPKDGVLVKGLHLQGAGWDMKNSCLIEAEPMQLVCLLPTIHFKPVEAKRRTQKGIYTTPCYYCPNRAGTTYRSSFVVAIDLRSGEKSPEHWTKRGTAILMSLDI